MQLKHYCSECGHPNIYIEAKPKFCAECGFNFSGKSVVKATAQSKVKPRPVVVEEDDETDDEVQVPNISKFKVEIQHSSASRGEKFENVYHGGGPLGINRPPPAKQYTIEDFKKEASNPTAPLELGGSGD